MFNRISLQAIYTQYCYVIRPAPCTVHSLIFCDIFFGQVSTMYVVKFALLFIVVVILSVSCVLTETLQNFSTFCHFSFEGGGGQKGNEGN